PLRSSRSRCGSAAGASRCDGAFAGQRGRQMTPQSISQLHATAPWWAFAIVIAALALHIGGGSAGILSGYAAVFARKGARLHRIFGTVFFVAMLATGTMGLALSV